MNARLDAFLVRSFPHVFADRHGNMRETAMCWGFECGNGWYSIIKRTAEKLEPLIAKHKSSPDYCPEWGLPRAAQIKEKFGTLRFYLTHGTEEMYRIVDAAEKKSARTCETCGRPGKLRGRGWYYTACKRHVRDEE